MTNFERTASDENVVGGAGGASGKTASDPPGFFSPDARGADHAAESRPRIDVGRLVRSIHDRCARRVAAALTEACRVACTVRVSDVEFVEYRQFVLNVESPTCLAVLRVESLDVPVALDLTSSWLFATLGALLGGKPRDEDPPQRPLTEIEQRLAARVVRVWQQELRSAWRDVAPLEPTFERWEYHPHRAALAPPREPLMVVRFQTTVGDVEGFVTLAIPRRAIDELSARGGRADAADRHGGADRAPAESAGESTATSTLELCLDEFPVSLADLRTLRIGDVIATSHAVDQPLIVHLDGVPRFTGQGGIVQGCRAVRLDQDLERS